MPQLYVSVMYMFRIKIGNLTKGAPWSLSVTLGRVVVIVWVIGCRQQVWREISARTEDRGPKGETFSVKESIGTLESSSVLNEAVLFKRSGKLSIFRKPLITVLIRRNIMLTRVTEAPLGRLISWD